MQNAHTYHFTLRSLSNVLAANGFSLVTGDEYVRAVFRKCAIPADRDVFQSDFADVMNYLRFTERARFCYYLRPSLLFRPVKLLKKALRRRIQDRT